LGGGQEGGWEDIVERIRRLKNRRRKRQKGTSLGRQEGEEHRGGTAAVFKPAKDEFVWKRDEKGKG